MTAMCPVGFWRFNDNLIALALTKLCEAFKCLSVHFLVCDFNVLV